MARPRLTAVQSAARRQQIVADLEASKPQSEIALAYGVSPSAISKIAAAQGAKRAAFVKSVIATAELENARLDWPPKEQSRILQWIRSENATMVTGGAYARWVTPALRYLFRHRPHDDGDELERVPDSKYVLTLEHWGCWCDPDGAWRAPPE